MWLTHGETRSSFLFLCQKFPMCTPVDKGEIIILSDDDNDEDCERDVSCSEPSVLIVEAEDVKESGNICVYFTC